MDDLLRKLKADPVGLVRRGVRKRLIDPLRYRRGSGYDAERYWGDRLGRYGGSLRGPGDEGLSDEENLAMYEQARTRLFELVAHHGVELAGASVLEIGVGNGFWARAFCDAGVKRYLGVDVTDVQFVELAAALPDGFSFRKADITTTPPTDEQFDLVTFIDVIEHIVERDALDQAMRHAAAAVRPGGVLVVSPIVEESTGRKLFYTRFWNAEEVLATIDGWQVEGPVPFRYSGLLVLRRPSAEA